MPHIWKHLTILAILSSGVLVATGQAQWEISQQGPPVDSGYDQTHPVANYWSEAEQVDDPSDTIDDPIAALTQRLEDLEESYDDLKTSYDDLDDAHSDLKKSLKGYAKSGHSGATMKVNGRIHADMWGFPETSPGINGFETGSPNLSVQDRVGFRRIRFGVKGDLTYNMLYKIEMEFAGGNDVEFRDVYLGWKELPVFQTLLLGNQKRTYGLDHLNSSRYNVFLERPFIIESFNQDARRFGLVSYGVSDNQAWNWRYGAYNSRLIQDEGNYISDHWQIDLNARLANTIWYDESSDGRGYAHWAVSGAHVNTDVHGGLGGRADAESRFRQRGEARHRRRWLDTGTRSWRRRLQPCLASKASSTLAVFRLLASTSVPGWIEKDSTTRVFTADTFTCRIS